MENKDKAYFKILPEYGYDMDVDDTKHVISRIKKFEIIEVYIYKNNAKLEMSFVVDKGYKDEFVILFQSAYSGRCDIFEVGSNEALPNGIDEVQEVYTIVENEESIAKAKIISEDFIFNYCFDEKEKERDFGKMKKGNFVRTIFSYYSENFENDKTNRHFRTTIQVGRVKGGLASPLQLANDFAKVLGGNNDIYKSEKTSFDLPMNFNNKPIFELVFESEDLLYTIHPQGTNSVINKSKIPYIASTSFLNRVLEEDELVYSRKIPMMLMGTSVNPSQFGREIYYPIPQLSTSFSITGKSGSGKSSIAESIVTSIFKNYFTFLMDRENIPKSFKQGLTVLDPNVNFAGGALNILDKIKRDAKNSGNAKMVDAIEEFTEKFLNVITINNSGKITPANLLNLGVDKKNISYKDEDLINSNATIIYDAVVKTWKQEAGGSEASVSFGNFRDILKVFLYDTEQRTIPDTLLFLENKEFAASVLERVNQTRQCSDARNNLKNLLEDDMLYKKAGLTITPRIEKILADENFSEMLSAEDSVIQPEKWLENSEITLFNLGGTSPIIQRFIGNIIMDRSRLHSNRERKYKNGNITFVDEAPNIINDSIGPVIQESRKINNPVGIMTQFLNRFENSKIVENIQSVGNVFIFNAVGKDPELYAKRFSFLNKEELINLDTFEYIFASNIRDIQRFPNRIFERGEGSKETKFYLKLKAIKPSREWEDGSYYNFNDEEEETKMELYLLDAINKYNDKISVDKNELREKRIDRNLNLIYESGGEGSDLKLPKVSQAVKRNIKKEVELERKEKIKDKLENMNEKELEDATIVREIKEPDSEGIGLEDVTISQEIKEPDSEGIGLEDVTFSQEIKSIKNFKSRMEYRKYLEGIKNIILEEVEGEPLNEKPIEKKKSKKIINIVPDYNREEGVFIENMFLYTVTE